jgi:outer membrane lipoprotein
LEVTAVVTKCQVGSAGARALLVLVLLGTGSALSACSLFESSPPFTKAELARTDREILFRDVDHHMKSMEGQRVVLGGKIISVKRGTPLSLVFVREYPLDSTFLPETDQQSRGDFAIETDMPLPKDRFKPGHTVEVIGTIRAPLRVAMGQTRTKRIPVVRAIHLHAEAPAPPPDPYMMDPGFMDPGMMDPYMMDPMMPMMW